MAYFLTIFQRQNTIFTTFETIHFRRFEQYAKNNANPCCSKKNFQNI